MNKPLVTLGCATYNQEDYVRETVQGLLSQTYEPLEIVISDDHSTDRTWEIINEEVDAYKKSGGIHKNIVLNRNEKNLGIALNSQKKFSLSHGVLLVENGGDDVSLPNRVERIVEGWEKSGRNALAIYHGAVKIDASGRHVGNLGEFYFTEGTLGAVATYSNKLIEIYGPITESSSAEDEVFGNRALILDGRLNLRENLLRYRVNVGVSSGYRNYRMKQIRVVREFKLGSMRQALKDLGTVKDRITAERYSEMKSRFERIAYENQNWLVLWDSPSFKERLGAFKILWPTAKGPRKIISLILLLPKGFGDMLMCSLNFCLEQITALRRIMNSSLPGPSSPATPPTSSRRGS